MGKPYKPERCDNGCYAEARKWIRVDGRARHVCHHCASEYESWREDKARQEGVD